MCVIAFMWLVETAHNVFDWYWIWYGFIKHAGTTDETILALDMDLSMKTNILINGGNQFLQVLRLLTADSIVVY
jgi:hypothetical protein